MGWVALFLAMALTATPMIPEGERSPFNPRQWASEAIWVGVQSCLRSMPAQTRAHLGMRAATSYCACTIDAIAARGQGVVTESDLGLCMNRARATPQPTGNAFRHKEWSSEAILAGIRACETSHAPGDLAALGSPNARWSFCSCVVDARRARRSGRASVVDSKLCLERAKAKYSH